MKEFESLDELYADLGRVAASSCAAPGLSATACASTASRLTMARQLIESTCCMELASVLRDFDAAAGCYALGGLYDHLRLRSVSAPEGEPPGAASEAA